MLLIAPSGGRAHAMPHRAARKNTKFSHRERGETAFIMVFTGRNEQSKIDRILGLASLNHFSGPQV